jgi:DNA-binding NarL/FixJ family response regulator
MIRIAVLSEAAMPSSLARLLETPDEVQVVEARAAPDVFLVHTSVWNREALARMRPPAPAIVVCSRPEEPFATDSILKREVSGVVLASSNHGQILAALRAAAAGLRVLQNKPSAISTVESAALTPREIEILRLIADGEGNKSIARLLEISQHTVKFHISSIFQKLQVSSRTEAVKAGITGGIIAL